MFNDVLSIYLGPIPNKQSDPPSTIFRLILFYCDPRIGLVVLSLQICWPGNRFKVIHGKDATNLLSSAKITIVNVSQSLSALFFKFVV